MYVNGALLMISLTLNNDCKKTTTSDCKKIGGCATPVSPPESTYELMVINLCKG